MSKIYGKQGHDKIVYLFIEILFFFYKKKLILIFLVITIYQFDKKKKKLDNNTFKKVCFMYEKNS